MLEVKNLVFHPLDNGVEKSIIEDISFTVEDGEMLVITGPNGGGKSTMAKLLMGIEPLDSTAEHIGYLLHVNLYPRKRRTPTGRAQSEIVLAREGRTIIWNTT